jgi:DNA-binding MarR family transcriptional regulator
MLPVNCLCILARRSARSLTEIYDRALEPAGLKITQFSLLRAIDRLEKPCLTDIAQATGLDRSTLGRNLKVLEKDGLVSLTQGNDERTRVPTLTAKAKQSLRIAKPQWERVQEQISSMLPEDTQVNLQMISNALEKLH